MKEIWKDIPEYKGLYQASNLGRIRSLDRYANVKKDSKEYKIFIKGRILKADINTKNYLYVVLYKDGVGKHKVVHQLVAQSFIPNFENKRTVNHINGIKTDNRVENLEWCTHQENIQKAWEIGLYKTTEKQRFNASKLGKSKRKKVVQKDLNDNVIKVWESIYKASETLNISIALISKCARKIKSYKTAGGYKWEYLEGVNNE